MASTIASYLTTAPATSDLNAPTQVQQPGDFESNQTVSGYEQELDTTDYHNIDWGRLHGFERPPPSHKKQRANRSHVWQYGWRLLSSINGNYYWICRLCHTSPRRPRNATDFSFICNRSTSSAIEHLRRAHRLGPHGLITVEDDQPLTSSNQSTIDGYCSAAMERNSSAAAFDHEVFKGLLTRLFTEEQLSLAKVDSQALRDLLIYLQPRCKAVLPSRITLKRYIASTYDHALATVEKELASASTRISLSFDLWTSPGRRLSLLGVVAHYLNCDDEPRAILLALPRLQGSHTASNVKDQITAILNHFKLRERFGNAVTDNASENGACMDLIGEELNIDASKRHVLCIGHVVNLVAHKLLFGSDVEAFETELESNVTAEVIELNSWRKKGPIGKLHNVIRHICASSTRRDVFLGLQQSQIDATEPERDHPQSPLHLIRDNLTRWNSWYDAAERALLLRNAIDEFIEQELAEHHAAVTRYERRPHLHRDPPKAPQLLHDKLSVDDWEVIKHYMELLKPCKQATMKLQGNVSTTTRRGRAVKGAIWQVLPVFDNLLKVFEEKRVIHLPAESQQPEKDPSPAPSLRTTPSPAARRTTRQSQRAPPSQLSATAETSADNNTGATMEPVEPQSHKDGNADYLSAQHHFNHNINAAWQKLDHYYQLSDNTPIYRAAVFLHPRLKWRWFERYWADHPTWIEAARVAIDELWSEYKHLPLGNTTTDTLNDEEDEWADDQSTADQLWLYSIEPHSQHLSMKDSPISYWISKKGIWPQLAKMALDLYATPAMSDEPERVFSMAGNLLSPRRRQLQGEGIEQMLCLRSWQSSGIVKLDHRAFNQAVATVTECVIDDDLNNATLTSDNLLYHEHSQY